MTVVVPDMPDFFIEIRTFSWNSAKSCINMCKIFHWLISLQHPDSNGMSPPIWLQNIPPSNKIHFPFERTRIKWYMAVYLPKS